MRAFASEKLMLSPSWKRLCSLQRIVTTGSALGSGVGKVSSGCPVCASSFVGSCVSDFSAFGVSAAGSSAPAFSSCGGSAVGSVFSSGVGSSACVSCACVCSLFCVSSAKFLSISLISSEAVLRIFSRWSYTKKVDTIMRIYYNKVNTKRRYLHDNTKQI